MKMYKGKDIVIAKTYYDMINYEKKGYKRYMPGNEYVGLKRTELQALAKERGLDYRNKNKADLIKLLRESK